MEEGVRVRLIQRLKQRMEWIAFDIKTQKFSPKFIPRSHLIVQTWNKGKKVTNVRQKDEDTEKNKHE